MDPEILLMDEPLRKQKSWPVRLMTAQQVAKKLEHTQNVLTISADNGEKYL
jgi:cysteine synthase